MISAEQKEYVEVSKEPDVPIYSRITENNHIITHFQTDRLLEQILQSDNLKKQLVQKLRDGKYKPNPIRRVEIPKEAKGEIRKLSIPTVVGRVFQ